MPASFTPTSLNPNSPDWYERAATTKAPLILCVDDSPLFLSSLQEKLIGDGFDPLVTTSIRTALSIIEDQPVDLLLTDLHMPEMDGSRLVLFAKRLRPDIITILVSATSMVPQVRSFDAVIGKGDHLPGLTPTINRLIASRSSAPEQLISSG